MLIFAPEALQEVFYYRFKFFCELFTIVADISDGKYHMFADLSAFGVVADSIMDAIDDIVSLKLLKS